MLAPREWRLETSDEFESDRARIEPEASRFDHHMRLWAMFLERQPFQFSEGLTHPEDVMRVVISDDPMDGVQYVVGITIDRDRRRVTLRWLDTEPL
jgi:hypothetical protein